MRWTLTPSPDREHVSALAQELGVDTIIAQLLVQRGLTSFDAAKRFFRPSLEHLHDPFLMQDMDKAVARITRALQDNERILVYGDYDVDGTTSVALVSTYLKNEGGHIDTYIPDRYAEGYGISHQGIAYAADNEITLIIALDCGIKAIDKVAAAQEKGIDFIICDHHRPGELLPQAVAVLDPKREDCTYPYDELCGCGIGFKLISALSRKRNQPIAILYPYLDLVATAIAADIVPITGENRVLTYFGLQQINTAPRMGFKAIIAPLKKKKLSITDVVFIIAPRINAAGRMKHGNHAVTLLTETDYMQAGIYAQEIEQFNTDRRAVELHITKAALQQLIDNDEENRKTTVVFNPEWHKGVIGIVASRLIENYYRPTIVFTQSGDKLTGSARSVKGFDVYEALDACKDHIEQFGGHKYAAGLTISAANYQGFKTAFETVVDERITTHLLTPEITIDAELGLDQISAKLYRIIKQLAPFGPGNMTPRFLSRQLMDTGYARAIGEEGKHVKATFKTAENRSSRYWKAIGFNMGDKIERIKDGSPFEAVYTIDENEWNGETTLQLKLKDIR